MKFGLKPLQILSEFSESAASRSSRHRKVEGAVCDECGVVFASNAELVLHLGKIKCKSIQVIFRAATSTKCHSYK
jgi:hypothetical protein